MAKIITAFGDRQIARQIAGALEASGLSVFRVCVTGNEVMRAFNQCNDGILVCGTSFADRTVDSLCEDLGERALVERAKKKLMDEQHITEDQAHRLLQSESMRHGIKMTESARLVLGED